MNRHCVIFVNSLYNIILAAQLRRSLFADVEFDIVLSDYVPGLQEVYDDHMLDGLFDHIYFANTKAISRYDRMYSVLNPGHVYKKVIGVANIPEYTDVFMWNPDVIFYAYYMHMRKHNKPFDLHVYGEANAGWFKEAPENEGVCFKQYGHDILNNYVTKHYDFRRVADMEFDTYVFLPEWCLYEHKHPVVAIPPIKPEDTEFIQIINRIFKYDKDFEVTQDVVFLGTVVGEADSAEFITQILSGIQKIMGSDRFIVKKHPRDDGEYYRKLGINTIDKVFPWDLYCLNNNIDDKLIISFGSAGVMVPCAVYGNRPKTLMIESQMWQNYDLPAFVDKMKDSEVDVTLVKTVDEILDYVKAYRQENL